MLVHKLVLSNVVFLNTQSFFLCEYIYIFVMLMMYYVLVVDMDVYDMQVRYGYVLFDVLE